jgi:hypothetical protein
MTRADTVQFMMLALLLSKVETLAVGEAVKAIADKARADERARCVEIVRKHATIDFDYCAIIREIEEEMP